MLIISRQPERKFRLAWYVVWFFILSGVVAFTLVVDDSLPPE
jgi:hypothetical protein